MPNPEMPQDPFPTNEHMLNDRMRKMLLFGISRGIIDILADNDDADAALSLAEVCDEAKRDGATPIFIDEIAIGCVKELDRDIYEDAIVVREILHPEFSTGL